MEPSSTLSKIFKILVAVDLVGLNIFVVYLFNRPTAATVVQTAPTATVTDTCGKDCQAYIDAKLAKQPVASVYPSPTTKVVYQTAPKTLVRSVSYVSVPGAGSSTNNNWSDVVGSDFYFDKSDYPGLVEVYFEVNTHLQNGNGTAFVRLYDVTHSIGVQGSDVQTSSQTSTLVQSGLVNFWSGKNLMRVQVKSLTADTAFFDSGRLRIVTEN